MGDVQAGTELLIPQPPTPVPGSGRGYLAESFGTFFRDPTWFKRALVGALIALVPLVGPIAILGYSMDWMRETAWGLGERMPVTPEPGRILSIGFTGFLVEFVWLLLGLLPLLVGVGVASAIVESTIMSQLEFIPGGGTPTVTGPPVESFVAAGVIGVVVFVLLVVCVVLARAGLARAAIYLRAQPGMPLSGVSRFIGLNRSGFWRAIGVSLLAQLPGFAMSFGAGLMRSNRAFLDPVALSSWLLYVLAAIPSFCATMISARAFGRWLREIDPRTLPPLGADVDDYGVGTPVQVAPVPEASDDPFSEAYK